MLQHDSNHSCIVDAFTNIQIDVHKQPDLEQLNVGYPNISYVWESKWNFCANCAVEPNVP